MRTHQIPDEQRVFVLVPWWSSTAKVVLHDGRDQLIFFRSLLDCDLIEGTYPFGMAFADWASPCATLDEEGRLNGSPVNKLATELHRERYGYPMVGDMVIHLLDQHGDSIGITMPELKRVAPHLEVDEMVYTVNRVRFERQEAMDDAA